jgi:regulator of protease activity HflC (stomatin/prohibitin superfamily)
MKVLVKVDERALVHIDGRPVRYLGPGSHRLWAPLADVQVLRFPVDALVVALRPEQAALVPEAELARVTVPRGQRAWVLHKGRAVRWLGVGEHLVWTVDPSVRVVPVDTSGLEAPLLDAVEQAVVSDGDYAAVMVPTGAVAVRFVDGAVQGVLGPGRHAAWTTERKVTFSTLDLRERVLAIGGQELMTKDRVTLRMNLSAVFKIADPLRLVQVARDPDEVLYLAVQLALREVVAARTLDELLADREGLAAGLLPAVRERAEVVGLALSALGVKDLVLPGEMKTLLNRVIEAQKEAEANVILRREETAATRSMAQTAKVLAENPTLLRLKELESYKELAAKVGTLNLVLGDGALNKLELKTGG